MLAENALSLAWRHWKLIGWGLTAAVLLALLAVRTDQRNDARAAATAEAAAHALTIANYRAAAAQARADMIANVRRVEAEQRAINEEVSRDYQAALADARARADALRLRLDSAGADPRGAAEVRVPGVSDTAGGPDAAAPQDGLPVWTIEDALIATEQALQLEALQAWVRKQGGVTAKAPEP